MDKCGIICEYNPFHNGHAHHILKTKQAVDAAVVCVMSGDFVQRAQPAVFDKGLRAMAALKWDADFVIELPSVFATAGAEQFAYGAVEVLSGIKDLKYLSFGVETENTKLLKDIAFIQLNETRAFKSELKTQMDKGTGYASALSLATLKELKLKGGALKDAQSELEKPNNILAIEYLKAIGRKNLDITPIFIRRSDGGYNSKALTHPYASASAIRELIMRGEKYSDFAPFDFGLTPVSGIVFEAFLRNALLNLSDPDILNAHEGIFNKLKDSAAKFCTLDDIINGAKSKRYTYSRLKRQIFQLAAGIDSEVLNHKGVFYARLLGMRKEFKSCLKDFNETILIRGEDEKRITDPTALKIYEIDKKLSDLYAVITAQSALRFYTKLITV